MMQVSEFECRYPRSSVTGKSVLRQGERAVSILALCAAGAISLSTPARAQDDLNPEQERQADASVTGTTIIVTAQRREQYFEDVPVSVSVIGSDEIEARGAATLKDLQYSVPSLQITEQSGDGSDRITLRGISPPGSGLPTVGRYLNDVSVNTEISGFGVTVPLFDVERVEVLRGPQGALYGEGSIGGTIRFMTKKPSVGSLDGFFDAEMNVVEGGHPGFRVGAATNIPLGSDAVSMRVAGSYELAGGYIDSPRFGDDINDVSRWLLRSSIRWQPSDAIDLNFVYQHLDSEAEGNNFSDEDYVTDLFVADPASGDQYDFFSLNLEADLGFADFTSTTGYIDRSTNRSPDLTSLFVRLAAIPGLEFLGTLGDIVNFTDNESDAFSQEVRLSSSTSYGGFWQVGALYRDSKSFTFLSAEAQEDPFDIGSFLTLLAGGSTLKRTAISFYGDYTHPIGESVEVNVGGRYYKDKRETLSAITTLGAPDMLDASVKNDKFTGRGSIRWEYSENHSAYVSVAQGFRSGGLQFTNIPGVPLEFSPELLTTYELGFKGNDPAIRLLYEIVVFRSDYDDVQVFAPNVLQLQAFDNAGKARMTGVDASFTWEAIDDLFLSGSFTYNDNEYREAGVTHNPGDPLDFVSKMTWSASADYSREIGGGKSAKFRVDYQHADAFQNSEGVSVSVSDDIDVINLKIGIEAADWGVYLYAENVTDENGVVFPAGASDVEPVLNRPRQFGIAFHKSF